MMNNNMLDLLQNWYVSQYDNDWEHQYGISIDTLDNPGWKVTIDLIGTELEKKTFSQIDMEESENNWMQCEVTDGKFKGAGGPKNLGDIFEVFLNWSNHKLDEQYGG